MSVEEAKRIALERAKLQAIADEFGTIVSQSTSSVMSNKNGESDTQFYSFGGTDIKGEWIETIGEPSYDIQFKDNLVIVTCSVKGKAREITSTKIDFIAKPLRNGTSLKYESTEFKDGDDLYLYFQSPVNGYLRVFLLDEAAKTVYFILPYKDEQKSSVEIIGGKEYIFFSVKDTDKSFRGKVDEYCLNCTTDYEFNILYILFSPNGIGQPNNYESTMIDIPDYMFFPEYKKWLLKSLNSDKKLQMTSFNLIIKK